PLSSGRTETPLKSGVFCCSLHGPKLSVAALTRSNWGRAFRIDYGRNDDRGGPLSVAHFTSTEGNRMSVSPSASSARSRHATPPPVSEELASELANQFDKDPWEDPASDADTPPRDDLAEARRKAEENERCSALTNT